MLARQTRGDAEPRQPHAAACCVHQDICGLDVLMDKAALMHSAERSRERDRDAQELRYVQWPAKKSIERRTAGILKHQRHAIVVAPQRDRARRPVRVKFGLKRIFVLEPLDATERGFFRCNKQDRGQAVAGAAVEGDVSLPQRREYVARELVHADLLPGGLLQYADFGYVCSGTSIQNTRIEVGELWRSSSRFSSRRTPAQLRARNTPSTAPFRHPAGTWQFNRCGVITLNRCGVYPVSCCSYREHML